jgi:hypothetical protein
MRLLKPAAVTALAFAAAAVATGAQAAKKVDAPRAEVVQRLASCRTTADAAARLACYDAAAAAFDAAEQAGEVVVSDQRQIQELKRQSFGLNFSDALKVFDRGDKPVQVDEVTLTVERAVEDMDRRLTLYTTDGQVWRQTSEYDMPITVKKGSQARVTRGVLGSFFIKVDGQSAFRAHRDQ